MTINPDRQHTLKEKFELKGKGLHTGIESTVMFLPAEPDFGIQFERIDLQENILIKADCDLVVDTSRSTVLEYKNARISTIEHLLAALVATGIDNCLIQINNIEVPILDGSAKPFIEAIEQAGIVEQAATKRWFEFSENIELFDAEKNVEMLLVPANTYQIQSNIDFGEGILENQFAQMKNISEFKEQFAPARTFCFVHELEMLIKNNLIKGGDLNNAVVLSNKEISLEEKKRLAVLFHQPNLEITKGYVNTTPLRFSNEPARHKLLDIVGDLALIGYPIKAKIIANRPGHKTNVDFAKTIKNYIKKNLINEAPKYNPDEKPVYTTIDILNRLPHRFPFLLVDKIIELSEKKIVGIKHTTINEAFYQGHFPNNPIFPGVLQIEALAQTGGILALNSVPDPYNYDTYFVKIDQCKFKQKITSGDTLTLKMEFLEPIKRGICIMKGNVYVGSKLCTDAILVAQIIKTRNEIKTI